MKIKAWILIILTYIFTFVTPVASAFFLLADDVYKENSTAILFVKGGFLFMFILTISILSFAIYFMKIVNKQKANHFKTIFKGGIFLLMMWLVLSVMDYVTFNIELLDYVIWLSMGGYLLGTVTKSIAIQKYYEYVRELGVF